MQSMPAKPFRNVYLSLSLDTLTIFAFPDSLRMFLNLYSQTPKQTLGIFLIKCSHNESYGLLQIRD